MTEHWVRVRPEDLPLEPGTVVRLRGARYNGREGGPAFTVTVDGEVFKRGEQLPTGGINLSVPLLCGHPIQIQFVSLPCSVLERLVEDDDPVGYGPV